MSSPLLSYNALYITFHLQQIGKYAMFKYIGPSTDKTYQEAFPKGVFSKSSKKGAITSSFF